MALIHVLHPNIILFLLLIGYKYFVIYFLSDVYSIYNFTLTVLAQKNFLGKLLISYHCGALVQIFEVDAFIYLQEYH